MLRFTLGSHCAEWSTSLFQNGQSRPTDVLIILELACCVADEGVILKK